MSRATAEHVLRSAEPSSPVGVPTAMKMICALRTPRASSVVKVSRFSRPVAADQLLQAGLVDRDLAPLQQPDLRRIVVDADDLVPVFRETGARHQPDVPSSDDRYFHPSGSPKIAKSLTLAQPKKSCQFIEL